MFLSVNNNPTWMSSRVAWFDRSCNEECGTYRFPEPGNRDPGRGRGCQGMMSHQTLQRSCFLGSDAGPRNFRESPQNKLEETEVKPLDPILAKSATGPRQFVSGCRRCRCPACHLHLKIRSWYFTPCQRLRLRRLLRIPLRYHGRLHIASLACFIATMAEEKGPDVQDASSGEEVRVETVNVAAARGHAATDQ